MSFLPLKRVRIVRDLHAGYEVQCWRWWMPLWIRAGGSGNKYSSTFSSIEKAEEFAGFCLNRFVKDVRLDIATKETV